MKFFKKRLNKRKLTKSLTETALIAPTAVHQHDNNKPLPPSPSLVTMPQQAPAATVIVKDVKATNSDSWLELNLPNDFSSSLDIPQLQTEATSSNKFEINTDKSFGQESEIITETSLLSYPDNHIDTTTHNEPNKPNESVVLVATTLEPSSSLIPDDDVDRDNKQDERWVHLILTIRN